MTRRRWQATLGVAKTRQELAKAAMALFWTSGYIVGALATAHTPALTATFWRLGAQAG